MLKPALSVFLATIFCANVTSASQLTFPTNQSDNAICYNLARTPVDATFKQLSLATGVVLGKHAEIWTDADFRGIMQNAKACDGQPKEFTPKVSYQNWYVAFGNYHTQIKAITDLTLPVHEQFKGLFKEIGRPIYCVSIFDYRVDRHWHTNNSKEVFGVSFHEQAPDRLAAIRDFANACTNGLIQIAKNRGIDEENVRAIIARLDNSIERDSKLSNFTINDLHDDLKLSYQNKPIPLGYLSPSTFAMVERINDALHKRVRLRSKDMHLIVRWAEQVLKTSPTGPDAEYAKAIMGLVTKLTFYGFDVSN